MISESILQLCALSVLCGAVMSFVPDGNCKSVCRILCTSVLVMAVLTPVCELDVGSYAIENAKLMEIEESFSDNARKIEDRLNHAVIQEKYREYILDKAEKLGGVGMEAEVQLEWNTEGLWLPYSCSISGELSGEQKQRLRDLIFDELGIPEERQSWSDG